jgi:hypothetical protein
LTDAAAHGFSPVMFALMSVQSHQLDS